MMKFLETPSLEEWDLLYIYSDCAEWNLIIKNIFRKKMLDFVQLPTAKLLRRWSTNHFQMTFLKDGNGRSTIRELLPNKPFTCARSTFPTVNTKMDFWAFHSTESGIYSIQQRPISILVSVYRLLMCINSWSKMEGSEEIFLLYHQPPSGSLGIGDTLNMLYAFTYKC